MVLAVIAKVFGDTGAQAGFFFQPALYDAVSSNGYPVFEGRRAKSVEYGPDTVHVGRYPGINDVSFRHREANVHFFLLCGAGEAEQKT